MIGNDVVDLGDPEVDPRARHPRFDRRVYSRNEREAIRCSGAPERLRWMLWAAKEAAYKVARKADPRAIFSPRRFEVELGANLRGRVCHAGGRVQVVLDESEGRIHCIASDREMDTLALCSRVVPFEGTAVEARVELRRLVCSAIAEILGLPLRELSIGRRGRIPVACFAGLPLQMDLSLSHHGRFLALVCEPGKAYTRRTDRSSSPLEVGALPR